MSYFGKTFIHNKDENFAEFLLSVGLPAEKIEELLKTKPTIKIEKNGDTYVLTTVDGRGSKEVKFQNGVEFEEEVNKGFVAKTTVSVSGDTFNSNAKFQDGRVLSVKREFSDNGVTVTISASEGSARRFYVPA